jgi:hypothetical protein
MLLYQRIAFLYILLRDPVGIGAALVSADWVSLASLWEAPIPHMVRAEWKVGKVQRYTLWKNELSVVFIPFVLLALELFGVSIRVCWFVIKISTGFSFTFGCQSVTQCEWSLNLAAAAAASYLMAA